MKFTKLNPRYTYRGQFALENLFPGIRGQSIGSNVPELDLSGVGNLILPSGVTISSISGSLTITVSGSSTQALIIKQTGDTQARAYIDGAGAVVFGGSGSSAGTFKLRQDPYTSTFMNLTNTAGPVSILVLDSDVANSGGPNAESTLTARVVLGGGAYEWVDWYHNHYSTNGDMNYGILMQKLGSGVYRNFTTAFTDNAVSDPSGQIKNSEWFSVITPTIPTGASGGTGLTGTGSTSIGSATVTGVGTAFLTELQINDSIAIGSEYRTVTAVTDNTHFTVSAVYTTANSGATINKFYKFTGRLGIRTRYPTAFLHIGGAQGGGATVGSAQFKIDAQALLTTPEAGAMEQETNNLYFTLGSTRYSLVMNNKGVSGGQTLIGGTGASQGLLLSSTSHATKGTILFGSGGSDGYNENTSTLTVANIAATIFTGNITLSTKNIVTDTSTGTKIGTASNQKLSLWNATPIVQPTTGIAASTFAANTSLIANDTATWDSYTIGQVVKALRNIGILA